MIGQNNQEAQTENRINTAEENITSNDTNDPTQVIGSQVDMHVLEKKIVRKMRNEVDSVIITVATRVQGAILFAVETFVTPRVELAMKSANAPSGRDVDSVVPNPEQCDFSGNIEGLHLTASD